MSDAKVDLNSPEVQAAIKAAVDEAVQGLKSKNAELLRKLDGAKSAEEKAAKYDALVEERDKLQAQLEEAKATAKTLQGKLGQVTQIAEKRERALQTTLIDGGLTEALAAANVAPEFMQAVKALLRSEVKVVEDGDVFKALIGDKPIAEHVKSWAQSDVGKVFIKAQANTGTGGPDRSATGSGKRLPEKPDPSKYGGETPAYFRDLVAWDDQQRAQTP